MSRTNITAYVGEDERKLRLTFDITPGSPGRGPSMAGPGEPPEPAEADLVAVRDASGATLPLDTVPTERLRELEGEAIEEWEDEDAWDDREDDDR